MPLTKPFSLGPFKLGMNNRLPETDLRTKEGTFLRNAVNVDIDATGRLSRRAGVVRRIAGVDCHSLWSDITRTLTYYVDGTTLYRVLNGARVSVKTGLTPGRRVSFDYGFGSVFWSNGIESGRIVDSTNGPWALPLPPHGFGLATTPNAGTIPPGTYRFYIVYTTSAGQESGASDAQAITCTSTAITPLGTLGTRNDDRGGSSITLTNLPTTLPTGVSSIVLYMTRAGGEVYMRVGSVGTSGTYTLTTLPESGMQGRTLGLSPLPVGDIVRFYNGRLLTASGTTLSFSDAYSPGLYNARDNTHEFPSDITLVMPVLNGIYVTADVTYWLGGDILDPEFKPLLPYGGVPRSDVAAIEESVVYWMSARGAVIGDDDGKITAVQEDRVAVDAAQAGASLVREANGIRQLIASTFGTEATAVAADTWMSAEVIRKGTVL